MTDQQPLTDVLKQSWQQSDNAEPDWLRQAREQQWSAYQQQGLPTHQQEAWKYADINFLTQQIVSIQKIKPEITTAIKQLVQTYQNKYPTHAFVVMVNGCFMPVLSSIRSLPSGMIISDLKQAMVQHADLLRSLVVNTKPFLNHPFAAINAALWQSGVFIYAPKQVVYDKPLHLLSIVSNEQAWMMNPQWMVMLDERSKLTLIDESVCLIPEKPYFNNRLTTAFIGEASVLDYYQLQQEGVKATHLSTLAIHQQCASEVNLLDFSLGGAFARHEVIVNLTGHHARCRTSGLCHLTDQQYSDQHIDVRHAAPQTKSEMYYKNVIDQKARAVFNGRVSVSPQSQKILAYQANHNLLLSERAEVYSKPELEIDADDVQCKHGATVGQVDPDALFYLRARGIPVEQAMAMLLRGFVKDIIDRVNLPTFKSQIEEILPCAATISQS